MDDGPDREEGTRAPTPEDLRRIASSLNIHGARYVVIGGFAMQHHGFARPTQGFDLLVDHAPDNVERVREALCVLEDRASLEVSPSDLTD